MRFLDFFSSFASSSSSSTSATIPFAGFFAIFFGPVPGTFVLPGLDQLLLNASCSTCMSYFEPELSRTRAFPVAAVRREHVQRRCSGGVWSNLRALTGKGGMTR